MTEKKEISPVVFKYGVVLALSIGGVIYTMIINKRSKASKSDCTKQMNSKDNHTSQNSLHFDPLATDKREEWHCSNNSVNDSPKAYSCAEKDTHEQEIKSLKNTVKILKEREHNLEIELLEYYGLKEQETAVMDLQNRLKLNNMESKLFGMKIESLQTDNMRLESQMTNFKKVEADLEAAKTKTKMLKKKLKSKADDNKKQILDFQQRVQKMKEDEEKRELSMKNLKSLESEVEELRKLNHGLQLERTDLAHRLDCLQILATSVLEDAEAEKIKEENQNLKKQNEDLSKEIERIQADRCTDVEELVYLRWINACLRYELKNYQPGPGKITASDLSKNLSPKSEEKAKQMILEYANKEGVNSEFDLHRCSNTCGEFDETFIDDPSINKNNNKFFGKLMRVLRGKDTNSTSRTHRRSRSHTHSRHSSLGKLSESGGEETGSSKHSMEPRKLTHRHSDSSFYKEFDSMEKGGGNGRLSCSSSSGPKSELVKYAEALKGSRASSDLKSHNSSPSLPFFC